MAKDRLEQACEDVDLLPAIRKGEEHNMEGWIPVMDEDRGGIIAYFGREEDAAFFRLAYINARLNPIAKKEK
jgi:hypothetical protein